MGRMKHGTAIALCLAICILLAGGAWGENRKFTDAGMDAYLKKIEENYQTAVSLKEKGDYEGSLAILQKIVEVSQGLPKYEIARLDTILEQARDMKESGNQAWKSGMKETGMRIKTMYAANFANPDYWLVYAKYSWLIEANKETHITKALKKALYYKPDNPEAYIIQADFQFDKAKEASTDMTYGMVHGVDSGGVSDKFSEGLITKSSYEAALKGKLSDARRAYIYYKLGNLEDQIFHETDKARRDWEKAQKLAPDSRTGQLAKLQLGK